MPETRMEELDAAKERESVAFEVARPTKRPGPAGAWSSAAPWPTSPTPDGVVATARQGEVHRMGVTPDQVSWGS